MGRRGVKRGKAFLPEIFASVPARRSINTQCQSRPDNKKSKSTRQQKELNHAPQVITEYAING